MISAFFPERFAAAGNDGGTYFLHQVDLTSTLWWYGEHPGLDWAHVYRGTLISDGGVDRWEGEFVDVPKGLACASGALNWRLEVFGTSFATLRRDTTATPFGGSQIVPLPPTARIRSAGVARQVPGYVGNGIENLTGLWIGDDAGSYYIREVSGTGQIAWVGENPEAESPLSGPVGRAWVNVAIGSRDGTTIRVTWSDVPKGEINNSGILTLDVESPTLLRVIRKTGGFGGNLFRRVDELSLSLRFTTLTVVDQQEWFLEADEPYFLALIALMDGRTVDLTNPSAATVDFTNSFVAPMLDDNVGAGTVIDLSPIPAINVPFRPVPGDSGAHPLLGIALRGAEQDTSGAEWRANSLRDWISTGGGHLERSVRAGETVNFVASVSRWHSTWTWRDEDDLFGLATSTYTFADLAALVGRSTTLTFALRGGDVRYDVSATLSVTGARGSCRP